MLESGPSFLNLYFQLIFPPYIGFISCIKLHTADKALEIRLVGLDIL